MPKLLDRREFLRRTAAAGLAASLAELNPTLAIGGDTMIATSELATQATAQSNFSAWLWQRAERLFQAAEATRDAIDTVDKWQRRRQWLRQRFQQALGEFPERSPLNVRVVGRVEAEDFAIEKVIFESRPGFYVTGNLYLPSQPGKRPGIVQPCGHSANGKAYESYQRLSIGFAKKGFVVLNYDPLGQGERYQYWEEKLGKSRVGGSTTEHSFVGHQCQLAGTNVAQYFIWDTMRGIDLLQSRSEVDPDRIGCTGCSGGGTNTSYVTALDERIQAAQSVCYITSLAERWKSLILADAEQNLWSQIRSGLDHAEYCMMVAPRALRLGAAIEDYFPIAGTRWAYERARRIYELLGVPEKISLVEVPGKHGYAAPLRQAAYEWLGKWLDNPCDPEAPDYPVQPDQVLQCTESGNVKTIGSRTVFQINLDLAKRQIAERDRRGVSAEAARKVARDLLLLDDKLPPPEAVIRTVAEGPTIRREELLLRVEDDLFVPANLTLPANEPQGIIVFAHERRNASVSTHAEALRELVGHRFAVLAVDCRGIPPGATNFDRAKATGYQGLVHGGDTYDAYSCLLLGENLLGLRARDVLQAARYANARIGQGELPVYVAGEGHGAVWALLAAVAEPEIAGAMLIGGLLSWDRVATLEYYWQPPSLLPFDVLRRADIPHLIGALAPRPVAIVNPIGHLNTPLKQGEAREILRAAQAAYDAAGAPRRLALTIGAEEPLQAALTITRLLPHKS